METDRSHTKECVRHLGFAHASLGEYVLARKYVKLLLIDDAEDPKALALKDLLDKQILNGQYLFHVPFSHTNVMISRWYDRNGNCRSRSRSNIFGFVLSLEVSDRQVS